MSDLSDPRDGIKATIEAQIQGLPVERYGRGPRTQHPIAVIEPGEEEGDYQTIGDNTFDQLLMLTVYVHSTSRDESYAALDEYRSPTGNKSIRAAINADRTLGGKVDDAQVGWGVILDQDTEEGVPSNEYACRLPIRIIKTVA